MVPRVRTPRLVATDLDGTLLDPAGLVTARTRAVLARLDGLGVPVVFVTARPLRWMDDLWPLVGSHGLAVVSNGAVVYDVAAGAVRELVGIDREEGLALVAAISAVVPGASYALEGLSGLRRDPTFREVHEVPPGTPTGPLAEIWDEPAVKVMVRAPRLPPEVLRAGVLAAAGALASVTWSGDGLMEIGPRGVTKASTLARLAAELGVDPVDVVAFGDAANDVPMLRWAGTSYAMSGADAHAREAADGLAPGHGEDGVAVVLEALFGLEPAVGGSP